jgi:hypothetical protein
MSGFELSKSIKAVLARLQRPRSTTTRSSLISESKSPDSFTNATSPYQSNPAGTAPAGSSVFGSSPTLGLSSSKDTKGSKPLKRSTSDQLKILSYSYVMSESGSLREAVAITWNIAELANVCYRCCTVGQHGLTNHRLLMRTRMVFVKLPKFPQYLS